jgi:hypothetical protein
VHPRAAEWIRALALSPHPEGGWFVERFRAPRRVAPDDGRPARPALTTIQFLLADGQHSAWHVVRSDEVWSFHDGDPLDLFVVDPATLTLEQIRLGAAANGLAPWHVVPAGHWQAARPAGAYTLVGCAVAPGFDYDDFALLRDEPAAAARLRAALPHHADLL